MAQLDHILLADGATVRPDGKIDIYGAAWDTIYATAVPAVHPQIASARTPRATRYACSANNSSLGRYTSASFQLSLVPTFFLRDNETSLSCEFR